MIETFQAPPVRALFPAPRLELDDQGFILHRRLLRPRHVSWASVEGFEISRTPGLPVGWRILAFLTMLIAMTVANGAVGEDLTDTSRSAICWRERNRRAGRQPDGWIVGYFGLPQEALLARLNARLSEVG